MVERGERSGFLLEPPELFGVVREGCGQDLQGNVAVELDVTGAIDLTHAPGAYRSGDLIGTDARSGWKRHGDGRRHVTERVEQKQAGANDCRPTYMEAPGPATRLPWRLS